MVDPISVRRSHSRALLLQWIAGFALVLFELRGLLERDAVLVGRDAFRLYLPLRTFFAEQLKSGHFPTWFPLDGLGTAFVGGVGGPLNPFGALALAMSPAASIRWQIIGEQWAALAGTYLAARQLGASSAGRWLAAIGYAGSGYLISVADNLPYHSSAAVLPWVALAAEVMRVRPSWREGTLLGLALAWSCWSGDLQAGLLQAMFAVILVCASEARGLISRVRALAVAGATCVGLVAPLVGGAWSIATESGRRSGLPLEKALIFSFHPLRIIELLIGPMFAAGTGQESWALPDRLGGYGGTWFAASEFCGTMVVLAACAALVSPGRRRSRLTYGLTLGLSLAVAFGRWGGVYPILHAALPFFAAFRYPEKLMPWGLLALSLLAGLGVETLLSRRAIGVAIVLSVLLLGITAWAEPPRLQSLLSGLSPGAPPLDGDLLEMVALSIRTRALVAVTLLVVFALMMWRAPSAYGWGAVVLAAVQMLWVSQGLPEVADASALEGTPVFVRTIESSSVPPGTRVCSWPAAEYRFKDPDAPPGLSRRLATEFQALLPDQPAEHGLGSAVAYQPGLNQRFVDACLSPPLCGTPCTRRMGARWIIFQPELLRFVRSENTLRPAGELDNPQIFLAEDRGARPLISTPGIHFVPAEDEVAEAMKTSKHEIPEAVMVGSTPDLPPQTGGRTFSRPRPSHIEAELDLTSPSFVVISEQLLAGWSATVDSKPVSIARADIAMGAVPVPAGVHRLELEYTPPGWPWVWIAYALGWAAVLAAFVRSAALVFRRFQPVRAENSLP